MAGHDPFEERARARPVEPALGGEHVDLGQRQRRERAGKARGRARGEDQFERIGQVVAAGRGRRARESRSAGGARFPRPAAGCCSRSSDRWPLKSVAVTNRSSGWPAGSSGAPSASSAAIASSASASSREKPSPQNGGSNQRARIRRETLRRTSARVSGATLLAHHVARAAAAATTPAAAPRTWRTREPRPRIGIEQHVDVGVLQPQLGSAARGSARWIAWARNTALIPPALAPATMSGSTRSRSPWLRLDRARAVRGRPRSTPRPALVAAQETAARAGERPDLLGDPVHVDRQADPAVADQRDPQFLLPHAAQRCGRATAPAKAIAFHLMFRLVAARWSKTKRRYVCQACGGVSHRWQGQCADCAEWNTLVEEAPATVFSTKHDLSSGGRRGRRSKRSTRRREPLVRRPTGLAEFDRALGGGLVPGSAILMGGDPGIGKSTLLLQAAGARWRGAGGDAVYISGEEAAGQVRLRAERLGLADAPIRLAAATSVRDILTTLGAMRAAGAAGDRFDPDHAFGPDRGRAGHGQPGARLRVRTDPLRQGERRRAGAGRPRHQGRQHRRAARARTHGRRGDELRRRAQPPVPHPARAQEPLRRGRRDRRVRDGRGRGWRKSPTPRCCSCRAARSRCRAARCSRRSKARGRCWSRSRR